MSVVVIDSLARGGSGTAPFAITKEADVQSSYLTVADLTARDAIPVWQRLPYMRVYVISTALDYRLDGNINTNNWTTISTGAGVYQPVSEKNQPLGYVGLTAAGKIDPSYIDNIYTNASYVTTDTTTRNALTTLTGDIIITTADSKIWVKLNNNPPVNINADFAELLFPGNVLSVNGMTGAVSVTIANLLTYGTGTTDFNNQVAVAPSVTSVTATVATHTGQISGLITDVGNVQTYAETHVGLANLTALAQNPTASETGYILTWNGSAYDLLPNAGGGGGGGGGWAVTGLTSLTGAVTIAAGANTLTFTSTSLISHETTDGTIRWRGLGTVDYGEFDFSGGSGAGMEIFAGSGANYANLRLGITAGQSFKFVHSGNFLVDDQRGTPRGIEYNADYAATYNTRSLVDKGAVISGTASQIPFINAAATKLAYSTTRFTWDDTQKALLAGNNFTFTSSTNGYYLVFGESFNITAANIGWSMIFGDLHAVGTNFLNSMVNGTNHSITGGSLANALINGGNHVISGAGTKQQDFITGSTNTYTTTAASGNNVLLGGVNTINGGSIAGAFVAGTRTQVFKDGGFAHGYPIAGQSTRPIISDGLHAINLSANSTSQGLGLGSLGDYGAIIGGQDHSIPATSTHVAIIGGNGIVARASSNNIVYVPALNLVNIAGDYATPGNGDIWYNSSTGKFRGRQNGATVDIVGGGGGSSAGIANEIQTSNGSGGFVAGASTTSAGNLTLGLTTTGVSVRTISTAGTGQADLLINPKADSNLELRTTNSGTPGYIRIQPGAITGAGVAAALDILGSDSNFSGVAGGVTTVRGGHGTAGNSNGGALDLQAGNSIGTGSAGITTIRGGQGTNPAGAGGTAQLLGGNGTGTNTAGGQVNITGGSGNGTGTGGAIFITSGTSVSGGAGNIQIQGGTISGTMTGGALLFIAGSDSSVAAVAPGIISMRGGNASAGNTAGGTVTITGGNAAGTGIPGTVTINGGTGGTGNGAIAIQPTGTGTLLMATTGTGAVTLGNTTGSLTVNPGTVVGSQTTQNLWNTVATTVNFAGAATTFTLGGTPTGAVTATFFGNASSGVTKTINIGTGSGATSTTAINIGTGSTGTAVNVTIGTTTLGTTQINGGTTSIASTTVTMSAATAVNVNGASPTFASTSTGTLTFFNTNLLTVLEYGAATSFTIGGTPTTAVTANFFNNATSSGNTKTINIGTSGATGSTTAINIGTGGAGTAAINITEGSTTGGTHTINAPTVTLGSAPGSATTNFGTSTILVRRSTGVIEAVTASGGGSTNFLRADGTWAAPAGGAGDMILATAQTSTAKKTFSVNSNIAGINVGANATDPTTTLAAGDMYYQTGVGVRIYSGSAWSTIGGGITNSAVNTELMQSDGTNAIGSGFYNIGSGTYRFGTNATSSNYILTMTSSAIASFNIRGMSETGIRGGDVYIAGGASLATNQQGGDVWIDGGIGNGSGRTGTVTLNGSNIELLSASTTFGSGVKVIKIGNRTTVPASAPTGGTLIYSNADQVLAVQGDLRLGDTGLAGSARTITLDGSAANVGITFALKGNSAANFNNTQTFNLSYGTGTLGIDVQSFAVTATKVSANTSAFSLIAANGISGSTTGNDILVRAGNGFGTGVTNGGNVYIMPGLKNSTGTTGNIAMFSSSGVNFQAMESGLFMANAVTAPTGNPTAGAFFWTDPSTQLPKWRVPGGTVYTLSDTGSGYTNLTQFVAQTAWRIFYSDGTGAVTELALGGSGTYLQSNGVSSVPSWATPAGSGDMVLASVQTSTGKKTFQPDATNAGINVGTLAGNPSGATTADVWVNTTTNQLMANYASANQVIANLGVAQTFTAKKTFTADATNAGINVGSVAGNPSSAAGGDIWRNSDTDQLMTANAGGVQQISTLGVSIALVKGLFNV